MAPIEQFFFSRDALPTIFDNQYTLCNEIEKTDYVMEIENKQDLTSWWVASCGGTLAGHGKEEARQTN